MNYDDYQYLIFERPSDGVLLITINRPERLNAANKRLHHELSVVWKTVDDDPTTRVAVITGAGQAFSAGGDLGRLDEDGYLYFRTRQDFLIIKVSVIYKLEDSSLIIVAVID